MILPAREPQGLEEITIPKDLVDWLNRTVPERCPDIQDTERAIWMYAGKRELVRSLIHAYERQQIKANIFS